MHGAAKLVEHSRFLYHGESQYCAHHEQHHLNDAILQHAGRATMDHLIGNELAVHNLVYDPQNREHTESAQERAKLRYVMERGDEPQSAYTDNKHEHTLPDVQIGVVATVRQDHTLGCHNRGQAASYPPCGQSPCNEAGQQQGHGKIGGRDEAVVPQHKTGRVANDGQSATTVGCKHDRASKDEPVAVGHDKLPHHRQHHHGCGEVVKIG